jgi:diacylglycerol kinase (ATP)
VAVVLTGWYVGVTRAEWCWIAFACMAVWSAEAFNTAIECLTDLVSPEFHPLAGRAKDTAAGAVLIAAIGAAIIGAMIFWPYLARSW